METVGISTYIMVFMMVFLPYLFFQFFMSAPKTAAANPDSRNLPFLYRRQYWILAPFSEILGRKLAMMQSSRAWKIKNQLVLGNVKIDESFVFAAEALVGLIGFLLTPLLVFWLTTRGDVACLAAVVGGVVGVTLPSTTIAGIADRRQTEIMRQLPFAIDLIGSAMRSGLDFSAAIRYYVATERRANPLAVEFGVMLRQMELGKTRTEALEDMATRIQTDEFRSFSAAVAHGTEVGASITETMKIQAEEMRRARFNRAERKAARAPSLMILPITLFIMPAIFIVIATPVWLKIQASGLGTFIK